MKVGDILTLKPRMDSDTGLVSTKTQTCRVTYIHPQRRYYVVEFTSERGETFRQTMYFPERQSDMRRSMATTGTGCGARGSVSPKKASRKSKKR